MTDTVLSLEALQRRRQELETVYVGLEAQIADLGFRRAATHGALLEIDRMLKVLAAETNGHAG